MKCDGCGDALSVKDAWKTDEVEKKVYHRRCWRAHVAKKARDARVTDKKLPDWYDESKVKRATFAFEGYNSAYSGFVVDLGDGTCRIAVNPLLGDNGPKWGDRVDLFYNPCNPLVNPWIGYRIYPEGSDPPGRHFGRYHKPTKEQAKEHERNLRRREKDLEDWQNDRFKGVSALCSYINVLDQHNRLLEYLAEKGVEVPAELKKHPDKGDKENTQIPHEPTIRDEERQRAARIVDTMRERCGCDPQKFCESFGCSSLRILSAQILGKPTEDE